MLGHVGTIFRSWALLGRILQLLLRLLSLLAGFGGPRDAPGSILEGPGRVRGRFGRPYGLIFRCFFAPAILQCETSPKGVSYWKNQYETRFFTYRAQRAHIKKRCKIVSKAFRAALPQKSMLKTCLGARPPRFWRGLGHFLAGFWALLGVSWLFLGAS